MNFISNISTHTYSILLLLTTNSLFGQIEDKINQDQLKVIKNEINLIEAMSENQLRQYSSLTQKNILYQPDQLINIAEDLIQNQHINTTEKLLLKYINSTSSLDLKRRLNAYSTLCQIYIKRQNTRALVHWLTKILAINSRDIDIFSHIQTIIAQISNNQELIKAMSFKLLSKLNYLIDSTTLNGTEKAKLYLYLFEIEVKKQAHVNTFKPIESKFQALESKISNNQDLSRFYSLLVYHNFKLKQYKVARKAAATAIKKLSERDSLIDLNQFNLMIARLYFIEGSFSYALQFYDSIASTSEHYIESLAEKTYIYYLNNDWKKALDTTEIALSMNNKTHSKLLNSLYNIVPYFKIMSGNLISARKQIDEQLQNNSDLIAKLEKASLHENELTNIFKAYQIGYDKNYILLKNQSIYNIINKIYEEKHLISYMKSEYSDYSLINIAHNEIKSGAKELIKAINDMTQTLYALTQRSENLLKYEFNHYIKLLSKKDYIYLDHSFKQLENFRAIFDNRYFYQKTHNQNINDLAILDLNKNIQIMKTNVLELIDNFNTLSVTLSNKSLNDSSLLQNISLFNDHLIWISSNLENQQRELSLSHFKNEIYPPENKKQKEYIKQIFPVIIKVYAILEKTRLESFYSINRVQSNYIHNLWHEWHKSFKQTYAVLYKLDLKINQKVNELNTTLKKIKLNENLALKNHQNIRNLLKQLYINLSEYNRIHIMKSLKKQNMIFKNYLAHSYLVENTQNHALLDNKLNELYKEKLEIKSKLNSIYSGILDSWKIY